MWEGMPGLVRRLPVDPVRRLPDGSLLSLGAWSQSPPTGEGITCAPCIILCSLPAWSAPCQPGLPWSS